MQLGYHQQCSIIGKRRRRMEREAESQQQQRGSKIALSCTVLKAVKLAHKDAMRSNTDSLLQLTWCIDRDESVRTSLKNLPAGHCDQPELNRLLYYIEQNFATEVWQTWPAFKQLLERAVTAVRVSPYAYVREHGIVFQSAKQARVYTAEQALAAIAAAAAAARPPSLDDYSAQISETVPEDLRPNKVLNATTQLSATCTASGTSSSGASISPDEFVAQSEARVAADRAARAQLVVEDDELKQLEQTFKQFGIERAASQQQGFTTTSCQSKTLGEVSAYIEDRLPKTGSRVTARLAARKVQLTSDEVRVYILNIYSIDTLLL
jgi:hypothetical protein